MNDYLKFIFIITLFFIVFNVFILWMNGELNRLKYYYTKMTNVSKRHALLCTLIISILSLFVSYVLTKDRFELSYTIEKPLNIIRKGVGNFDGINISFKGEKLEELYASVITLENTGNRAIDSSFISKQFPIVLSKGFDEVLTYSIRQSSTSKFTDPSIVKTTKGLEFEFEYLNPQDTISVTLLHSNPDTYFEITGAGRNLKRIKRIERPNRENKVGGRMQGAWDRIYMKKVKKRFDN